MELSCYGRYDPAAKSCTQCRYRHWCRSAADPELLNGKMKSFDEGIQDGALQAVASVRQNFRRRKINGERLEYSRNDLLEVITYMLNMDELTLELLDEKIKDPTMNLSEIGRRRQTSRQAVQQALKRKCREYPELVHLLDNHTQRLRQRKQTTFMEAVCQIRRQQRSANSNSPAAGSKFYRSLNSWSQNFDLSKMSILKGSIIYPSV